MILIRLHLMKLRLYILISLLLLLVPMSVKATHIVGGELYYESLGNNQYRVVLKIYRDCLNGQVGFDDPASVGIFNSSGILVNELLMPSPIITQIPVSVSNPCLQVPPVICTEQGVYTSIITLPPTIGGYDLVYQRCCRNNIIQNIVNPDISGSTYISHIPGSEVVAINSAPHFINLPPLVLCNGEEFVFDHSATDPDGDQLVYEFCDPYLGASDAAPMPQPPNNPPYSNISWSGGYNTNNQILGSPNLQINSTNGQLTCTPSTNGIYVVGICVKEYRNGILINTTLRDYQFTVVTCSQNVISAVPNQTVLCDGYTLDFNNQSVNSTYYHWDFGVPGITSDTSNLESPIYTYPDTGLYEVTLIANPGWSCADTSIAIYLVQYPITGTISPVTEQCMNDNNFDFQIAGNFTTNANVDWNFGNSNPLSSTSFSPNNIEFLSPGIQTVVATVSDRQCERDFILQVNVIANSVADIAPQDIFCDGYSVSFMNQSQNSSDYFWDFGVLSIASDTSTLTSPTYVYADTGTYIVTLIANPGQLCPDTTTSIFIIQYPIEGMISPVEDQCFEGNSFDFDISGNFSSFAEVSWSFSNSNPPGSSLFNPTGVEFLSTGIQSIIATVNDRQCTRAFVLQFKILDDPIAVTNGELVCNNLTFTPNNSSSNATGYFWDFGVTGITTDTSNLEFPEYTYLQGGIYEVTLVANNENICHDTIIAIYDIRNPINPSFLSNSPQCIDFNSFNFILQGNYSNNALFSWEFGNDAFPQNSTVENPSQIVFDTTGHFPITIEIEDDGCFASLTDTVMVYPIPIFNPIIIGDTGCIPFTVTFESNSTFEGSANYFWDFGDGATSTDPSPTHIYTQPGAYTVSFSITTLDGCIRTYDETFANAIQGNPSPIANFTVTKPDLTETITITDNSSFDVIDLLFEIEGNTFSSTNFDYTFQGYGDQTVTEYVTNEYNCTDTAIIHLEIDPDVFLYIPNSFTPNFDGVNEVFRPVYYGIISFRFMIFDRWGQLIYLGNEASSGWDGSFRGLQVQNDIYVWKIDYFDYDNIEHHKYGHVSVLK